MRYLGSKDSLCGEILRLLQDKGLCETGLTFFDAFCGTGAVADLVKGQFNLVVNDLLLSSVVYTSGRLFSSVCTFSALGFDPFDYLNQSTATVEGFFYKNYSPGGSNRMYFSPNNASRIDYFRKQIEQWRDENKLNDKEYVYLLACLIESVSKVSNTAGVYGAFLKYWDPRAYLDIRILPLEGGPLYNPNIIQYNRRIEEIIQDVECDILYLDPPYTQNQYGTQYHLLETLVLDDNPPVSRVTGSRPITPLRSDWSKDLHAHILFERIIATTKAKHIVFSYNNDGFMSKDYIESTLKRFGEEGSYEYREIDYKKYNNTKCVGKEGHKEYLFYIKKKRIDQVVIESPLNYSGSKAKMVNSIKQYLPNEITTFIDVFGGGFNVGINIPAEHVCYNDINPFVVGLIRSFIETDTYQYLKYVYKKIKDYGLGADNPEGYYNLRNKYNAVSIDKRDPKMLYSLILFGFQQQIRFNDDHEFNIPCGQRKFNDRLISKFISFSRTIKEKQVAIENLDFREMIPNTDTATFLYLDPPYRATTATYNDGKRGFEGWTLVHETALCELLTAFSNNGGRFMLSYQIDVDDFHNTNVEQWANDNGYRVIPVTEGQGRYNNRQEVLIVNY